MYLGKTRTIRGQEAKLFISFAKPSKAVSKDTLSIWINESLRQAGIDTVKYSAHCTRAASTTAACKRGLSVENIMKAAGWSRSATFSKYYQKKIENLAHGLLDACKYNLSGKGKLHLIYIYIHEYLCLRKYIFIYIYM